MSVERPDWHAVPTPYGSSFVRDIEFPERGLKGRYTKTLNRRGGLRFQELLLSSKFNVVRELGADFDESGKRMSGDISLSWSGRVRNPLAFEPHHNPFQEASMHILGTGTTTLEGETWMVSRRVRTGGLTLDYFKSKGKIASMTYEPATVDYGLDLDIDRQVDFLMDPRGSIHALSSLFFENGADVFTMYEGGNPKAREIELNQRGWTDQQKEYFKMALDEILASKTAEGFLDERLSPEQKIAFVARLRNLVSGGFKQKSFPEKADYLELRHAMEEELDIDVVRALEINAFDQQTSVTPIFEFYEPTENQIAVVVKSKEKDELLMEYDLPYGEEFRYDRFVLNFSRSNGKLLMAVSTRGKQSQKEWFFINEKIPVADVEKLLKASSAERWAQSIRFVPGYFTDEALSLASGAENPHAALEEIWLKSGTDTTARGATAKEHVDNCPHCKVNIAATTNLLRQIFGGNNYGRQ